MPLRLNGPRAGSSVLPLCAGGSHTVLVSDARIVNVEGDPASSLNEGTLRPKGAAAFQLGGPG